MAYNPKDPSSLAPLLEFVADELRSGKYESVRLGMNTKLVELFPLDAGEDPNSSDNDAYGFIYTNDKGIISLVLRIKSV